MIIEQKLLLIKKLYSNIKDLNYFYNPLYGRKTIDINNLKNKWKAFFESNIKCITNIYVHIPFCIQRCNFCQYYWYKIDKNDSMDDYVFYLVNYIKTFKSIFKWKECGWIYFWGWTPSILSEKQLEKLLKELVSTFNFNNSYFKEFELNPVSTSYKKLDILHKYWINRISFWIQSFNKKTLEKEWRIYYWPKNFKKLVNYAKRIWINCINADLILWLNTETKEETLSSLKEMMKINLDYITLHTIQGNKETSHFFDWETKFFEKVDKSWNYILKNLPKEASNYKLLRWTTNMWMQFRRKYRRNKFIIYNTHQNVVESIFWIWFWAASHIFWFWKYYIPSKIYELKNMKIKFENLTLEEEKKVFIARAIQYGKINLNFFKNSLNLNFLKENKEVINFLIKRKKISINEKYLKFKTKNILDSYIYWLLFFDLKFILHHALYIDKNYKK